MDGNAAQKTRNKKHVYTLPGVVIVMSLLALVGWATNIPILFKLHKSFPSLNPLTALLFVLSGLGLALIQSESKSSTAKKVLLGLVGIISTISIIHLIDTLTGSKLGLDQLMFTQTIQANAPPISKTSLSTVVSFFVLLNIPFFHIYM